MRQDIGAAFVGIVPAKSSRISISRVNRDGDLPPSCSIRDEAHRLL
jgi:hypothetical protein